jgi:murein DD-endopeptidase MepM/ murein hydrolase activator NlpD
VASDTTIGKVGASGNSISPHIHMAIRVYKEDPRKRGVLSIGYLLPDQFFPFGRKGMKTP